MTKVVQLAEKTAFVLFVLRADLMGDHAWESHYRLLVIETQSPMILGGHQPLKLEFNPGWTILCQII